MIRLKSLQFAVHGLQLQLEYSIAIRVIRA